MTDLSAAIRRESELLAAFIGLLREEQNALQQGDAAALPGLNHQKSGLIEELDALAGLRNALLAKVGCAPDREGMQQWLARPGSDKTVRPLWAALLKSATEARELNELNGKLVAIRLQATQEALAILTQQARQTSLYGPNGQASPLTGLRIIDSA